MAKVWFVRRRGAQWIAPGGAPVIEVPLSELVLPLDLGVHRRLAADEAPLPAPELSAEPPSLLNRVVVEIGSGDVSRRLFSGYQPGIYDSGLSPAAASARLGRLGHEAG